MAVVENGVLLKVTNKDLINGSFDIPNDITSIGENAFCYCDCLKNIDIPINVINIEDNAFNNCTNLTEIKLHNNITNIGHSAFYGCKHLKNIVIPNGITAIKSGTFYDCINLTNVSIPNSLVSIENNAFSNCNRLSDIIIPNSVISIGDGAFNNCKCLTTIDIPNSVTNIGNSVFSNCIHLKNVKLPASLTSIGNGMFSDCTHLTNIDIPNGIVSIGQNAFSNCTNLANLIIPQSVTSIGYGAFNNCTSLVSIYIPNNITVIDSMAFAGCFNLKQINYNNHILELPIGVNSIKMNNHELLISYNENKTNIIIKDDGEIITINDNELGLSFYSFIENVSINSENTYSTIYKKIKLLMKKGITKPSYIFLKIPLNKLEKLDCKFFFTLVASTIANEKDKTTIDNIKSSILEMIYALGAFDNNIITRNGFNCYKDNTKYLHDINNEGRKNFILNTLINPPEKISIDDYNKLYKYDDGLIKKAYVYDKNEFTLQSISREDQLKLINIIKENTNLMISNKNLHLIFSGMNLNNDFDSKFYVFFRNNYQKIISNDEYISSISAIQRNFEHYYKELGLNPENITIEAVIKLRKDEAYDGVKKGCYRLAREAKSINNGTGVTQSDYLWYQNEAYPVMLKRKNSSIPNIKVTLENGISGEFLRLDDINNLLAGEKTDCCQRYDGGAGAGMTSMMHASFSSNGRIFLVRNKEGEILGQSWVWFNDNTLCFDNFEASSKYKNSVNPQIKLDDSFNKYKASVRNIYIKAANEAIKITDKTIEELQRMNNINYESARIKAVTMGTGYDDSHFLNTFPTITNVVEPPDDLELPLYTDAQHQVLIAGEEAKEHKGLPKNHIFRDRRAIMEYNGDSIDEDLINRMKEIEKSSHNGKIQQIQGVNNLEQLCNNIFADPKQIHIILGEDFYYMYIEKTNEIEICDFVRGKPRFDDEKLKGNIEIYKTFNNILSTHKNMNIRVFIRNNTNNKLLFRMIKNGQLELAENVAVKDLNTYDLLKTFSKDEYLKFINENEKEENDMAVYDVVFKLCLQK